MWSSKNLKYHFLLFTEFLHYWHLLLPDVDWRVLTIPSFGSCSATEVHTYNSKNCHSALFLHQFYFHGLHDEHLITQQVWEKSTCSVFEMTICKMQEITLSWTIAGMWNNSYTWEFWSLGLSPVSSLTQVSCKVWTLVSSLWKEMVAIHSIFSWLFLTRNKSVYSRDCCHHTIHDYKHISVHFRALASGQGHCINKNVDSLFLLHS